ncbi:chemotaxis protein [Moritella viscosa]|uniref:Chemotaxis protein CheV n=1 Tax=Moritella viscosa TaxID=80854 RepID=A0A090IC20_9GAMM|nr:chemotaxis protein [Moritella viscosa]CED58112.1 chemotaxis protein CheV [Moritella viscosa]SGY93815.1 Chemotaxis protein CheV [Moritella viscosa]SGY98649.1 Chemotaxis protein CheV [Moritella viscosa]SGY99073.1 Chemotaxis protein CheV [Moritella viscosa]SGZ05103.1 Chemotaxis protein CheV [Moritella viscosa]
MNDNRKVLLESGTNELELAEFQLIKVNSDGTEKINTYGINVAKVREVIRFPDITDYPKSIEHIVGVFKSRDQVTPLINLSKWLGISEREPKKEQFVIVTDFNGITNGFLIDHITRIHRVSWSNLETVTNLASSDHDNCVVASVTIEDHLVFILDFEKIISDINPTVDMGLYDLKLDSKVNLSEGTKAKRFKHTILLVDDSSFILDQLRAVILESGYSLITAVNGEDAWGKYKENFDDISLIVTDVEMPKMDGLHLCKKVTSEPNAVPVVIFSSTMSDENKIKAMGVGATETLTKPEINKLIITLDELLNVD